MNNNSLIIIKRLLKLNKKLDGKITFHFLNYACIKVKWFRMLI